METDEAREAELSKRIKNNTYRLVQNRYGHLQETDPNPARNAKTLGVISFWQRSEKKGYWCTHSFYASNPIALKTSDEEGVYKNILFVGRDINI